MEDKQIVNLFFERSEDALTQTKSKYGRYIRKIVYNILNNREDTEECENTTYLRAWESIPPHRPENLATYLGKIARNLALDVYDRLSAKKRGSGQVVAVLDELAECVGVTGNVEKYADEITLKELLFFLI